MTKEMKADEGGVDALYDGVVHLKVAYGIDPLFAHDVDGTATNERT